MVYSIISFLNEVLVFIPGLEQQILLGKEWFFSVNIYTDIFSIVVVSLIALFITKAYDLTKNKKYVVMLASFYMLLFGFICKIISNIFAYMNNVDFRVLGLEFLQKSELLNSQYWFALVFLVYEIVTLLGMYFLYHVYNRNEPKSTIILVTYLLCLSVMLSYYFYYVFYMTYLGILVLISMQFWTNYSKTGFGNTALLATSFSIIALAQLIFIIASVHSLFYAVAVAIQIVGYLLLLVTFVMVLKYGKKKEPARHNR